LENFNHYDNFHGCLIKIHTINSGCIYPVKYNDDPTDAISGNNHRMEFGGLIFDIVIPLAKKTNFTSYYTYNTQNIKYMHRANEVLRVDGTLVPKHSVLIYFFVSPYDLKDQSRYNSLPIGETKMYYLITEFGIGNYTNYEKMVMPFDAATWVLLLFTFGLTFGAIFGLRLCPRMLRIMVFGEGEQV
jgi:hypothetical protein